MQNSNFLIEDNQGAGHSWRLGCGVVKGWSRVRRRG